MSTRKFARPMKILTIIIAISMLIPVFVGAYTFFANRETKTVMLKVDGEKIYKEDFEKNYQKFEIQLNEIEEGILSTNKDFVKMPDEIKKGFILAGEINEALNNVLIKKLGASASKNEVEQKFIEFEEQFGGSRNLIAALQGQGLSVEEFRNQIKKFILNTSKLDIIKSKIKVTEDEIKDKYDQLKFSEFEGKSFDDSKEEIRELILNSKANLYERSLLEDIYIKAKFVSSDEEVQKIVDKLNEVVYEKEEFKFTNYDLISQIMNLYTKNIDGYNDEFIKKVKEVIENSLNRSLKIKDKALEVNLTLNNDLLPKQQLDYIANEYIEYIYKTHNPSESDLLEIFHLHRDEFNIKHTVSGEIIGKVYTTDEKDLDVAKERALTYIKDITKDNFDEKAKELSNLEGIISEDLTGANINNFVPEFKNALSNGKVDDILGPIKTQFGYHIIHILSKDEKDANLVDSKHILIKAIPSNETKETVKKEVNNIKNEILDSKLTWENINSDTTSKYKEFTIRDNFSKITIDTKIPKIGYQKEINQKLFSINVGEFIEIPAQDSYVIIQKTDETKFREVSFDEVKEKIRLIAINLYVANYLSEL